MRIHVLGYGLLLLLCAANGAEVWMRQQSVSVTATVIVITVVAWWVGMSYGRLLALDGDGAYDREYRRLIAREKRRNPQLAPFIDQQTIASGHGIIDAEG